MITKTFLTNTVNIKLKECSQVKLQRGAPFLQCQNSGLQFKRQKITPKFYNNNSMNFDLIKKVNSLLSFTTCPPSFLTLSIRMHHIN